MSLDRSVLRHELAWLAACAFSLCFCAPAFASVVQRGFITMSDGTQLNYILTLPSATGTYPVALTYDPYAAGYSTGSDLPSLSVSAWNNAGYAHLGVNFRGTGCSGGTFQPLDAEQWGKDGATVVDWAANQSWSNGRVGMFGFSFPGVSQLATAAFSSKHLMAIAPWNVFTDFYRDVIYPGGISNNFGALWIAAGRAFVGIKDGGIAVQPIPQCEIYPILYLPQNAVQAVTVLSHPYDDSVWSQTPDAYIDQVKIPVLGCVNWQDTTIYSRAFEMFQERLDPDSTWLMGSNGSHYDCAASGDLLLKFFDRYVKGIDNGWESTPHVMLAHEVATGGKAAWNTSFPTWADVTHAVQPVTLHLHADGLMDSTAPATTEPADRYSFPGPTDNTPEDWIGISHWQDLKIPGTSISYTTPALQEDAEFLGPGSINLWISSTATDTDIQATLSEIRPDGQEMFVENGWLRLSHRKLDPARSTVLRPYLTHQKQDAEPLTPGQPVRVRFELLPFNHVFRAGSAIRLGFDTPGNWFQPLLTPATNTIYHEAGMDSQLVLGWLPGGSANAPMPDCGTLLNQPCRVSTSVVPAGILNISALNPNHEQDSKSGGGAISPWVSLMMMLAAIARQSGKRSRSSDSFNRRKIYARSKINAL